MSLETLKALGVRIPYKAKYDNFIGGKWVAPVKGEYFDVISPITGKPYTKAARSSAEDVELALDAAHAAADKWGTTSTTERANILLKIADRIEQNLELIATADTVDNGKPIRETMNADIPLTVDHFRCGRHGFSSGHAQLGIAEKFEQFIGLKVDLSDSWAGHDYFRMRARINQKGSGQGFSQDVMGGESQFILLH